MLPVAFLLIGFTIWKFISNGSDNYSESISVQITETVKELDSILPITIDKKTRWDAVQGGPGENISYLYTLLNFSSSDLNANELEKNIFPNIKAAVCNSKNMQEMFDAGITAHYIYYSKDGVEVARFTISKNNCDLDI